MSGRVFSSLLAGLLTALLMGQPAQAQQSGMGQVALPAPAQPDTIELSSGTAGAQREVWHQVDGTLGVRNVTRPTLTVFRPVGRATDVAVIIAPGGAFLGLAIEKEGWQVARWFALHGITAFVLKYRTLPTPPDQALFASELGRMMRGEKVSFSAPKDTPPEALADGLAALRHVRGQAAAYGVDAAKVGFMGFSAGGFLTRSVVEHGGVDRPDFASPIYPTLAPMVVPADAPPMFVAVAADDFVLKWHEGLPLVDSYRRAGKSIEFHLFSAGGHGFGIGPAGSPAEGWLDLNLRWLRTRGLLKGAS